ncbi:hypothetical protein HMI56_003628 [Coelomomyces lativittatus]|nr:hypothetical protein HMI56_003628 [Coelomomyces lativittatus]
MKFRRHQSISDGRTIPDVGHSKNDAFQLPKFTPIQSFNHTRFTESMKLNTPGMDFQGLPYFPVLSTPTQLTSLSSLDILGTFVLPLESLTVGTWRRLALGSNNLTCSYSLVNRLFSWTLMDQAITLKMEILFTSVRQLLFRVSERMGEVHLILNQSPTFWMKVDSGNSENYWTQCHDFTENNQAETTMTHTLRGQAEPLHTHFSAILQSDSGLRDISSMEDSPTSTLGPSPLLTSPPGIFNRQNPFHPVQKLKTRPRRSASAPLVPNFQFQQMASLQFMKLNTHQPPSHSLMQQEQISSLPSTSPAFTSFHSLPANLQSS